MFNELEIIFSLIAIISLLKIASSLQDHNLQPRTVVAEKNDLSLTRLKRWDRQRYGDEYGYDYDDYDNSQGRNQNYNRKEVKLKFD